MTNARGDEAKMTSRIQAAFGTAEPASDGTFVTLPYYSYNVSPSEELTEDEAIYGDAFPGETERGLRNVAGSMEVPLKLNSIGWHLRSMLGDPVTTELVPGVDYSHVFTPKSQPIVPLLTNCISHTRLDTHFVQDSLTCAGMEFRAQKNGSRNRVTLNMIGRAEETSVAELDATPVAYAVDPATVGFHGKVLVGAAEVADVTGMSMTLNSGVEADQETLNGLQTAAGFETPRWGLTGTLDTRYRDNSWYDRGSNGTLITLKLNWTLSASYSLEIEIPSTRIEMNGIPIGGRGVISAPFSFMAERPAAGAELCKFTLLNKTADYANPA
jgi:hypothetical protein